MRKSSLAVIAGIVPNSAVAEEDDLAVRDGVKYGKSKNEEGRFPPRQTAEKTVFIVDRNESLLLHNTAAPFQRNHAGTAGFDDTQRPHDFAEGIDLRGLAGDFNAHVIGSIVDDLGAVDLCGSHDLAAGLGGVADLNDHQFPLYRSIIGQQLYLLDIVKLFQLIDDLIPREIIAPEGDGQTGVTGVIGLLTGKGVDVEAPAHEQAGNTGYNTVFVLNINCNDVTLHA